MFEPTRRAGVLRLAAAGTRWLSTGWAGGFETADAAYAITVPAEWPRTDLDAYVRDRRRRAGFEAPGPAVMTAVDLRHARGARLDAVTVYATVGLSNPAALPMDVPTTAAGPDERGRGPAGTVNLIVGADRALDDAAMANLVAVAAEAKAATLLAETGFPGTTSDAIIAGCTPDGEPATFTGSATAVGDATRACVRDAIRASLASKYPDGAVPETVADADHGVVTDRRAEVIQVDGSS